MTTSSFAAAGGEPALASTTDDLPRVCNIGPAEIRRRRLAGHVGLVASIALLALLLAIDAPPISRLLVIAPATIAASGYLQAWLKFCAGFGQLGIFNFGALGNRRTVADDEARAADRARARQISSASFAIAVAVGILAVLLPI
jgi:hypothetical protein